MYNTIHNTAAQSDYNEHSTADTMRHYLLCACDQLSDIESIKLNLSMSDNAKTN